MTVSRDGVQSPASLKMDEAIELAIEERSPFPERSSFIDADTPHTDDAIRRAAEEDYSAVVVYPDGSTRVFSPREVLEGAVDAA
jgi:hypothetical protein